jgi:hypothetical protein
VLSHRTWKVRIVVEVPGFVRLQLCSLTGFCLEHFFHILGMSSSQLTNSIIFHRGTCRAQPPTSLVFVGPTFLVFVNLVLAGEITLARCIPASVSPVSPVSPCFRLMFQLEDQQIPLFFLLCQIPISTYRFQIRLSTESNKSSQSHFMFFFVKRRLLCPRRPFGWTHRTRRPRKLAKDNKNKPGEGQQSMDHSPTNNQKKDGQVWSCGTSDAFIKFYGSVFESFLGVTNFHLIHVN